jgi:hypothetical protein
LGTYGSNIFPGQPKDEFIQNFCTGEGTMEHWHVVMCSNHDHDHRPWILNDIFRPWILLLVGFITQTFLFTVVG